MIYVAEECTWAVISHMLLDGCVMGPSSTKEDPAVSEASNVIDLDPTKSDLVTVGHVASGKAGSVVCLVKRVTESCDLERW